MRAQTFRPEGSVERFDERVVLWLPWPREVESDATLISPQIQIARHKLGALIDADRCRKSDFPVDPFQHLHDIDAAEGDRGSSAGENREKVLTIVSTRSLRPAAS